MMALQGYVQYAGGMDMGWMPQNMMHNGTLTNGSIDPTMMVHISRGPPIGYQLSTYGCNVRTFTSNSANNQWGRRRGFSWQSLHVPQWKHEFVKATVAT
jgi:hypothetical protein